ncbi:MAG: hypothetical protein ABR550_04170 [Wenzhouxiangellaceae bacterium]
MSPPQLPLSLVPPRRRSFDNFIVGPNATLVTTLRHGRNDGQWFCLLGPGGSGKTHLALAVAGRDDRRQQATRYIPAGNSRAVRLLQHDNASGRCFIVDDIDALARSAVDELALFNALNAWRAQHAAVLLTASSVAGFQLPDLVSRIGHCARLNLQALNDAGIERLIGQLIEDFQIVAGRGLSDYLLRHGPRAAGEMTRLFERMARRAMAERRALSIPLARECLTEQQ